MEYRLDVVKTKFEVAPEDEKEAYLYFDRDGVREFTLSSLFNGAIYCLLSIGQLYKTQKNIYRIFTSTFTCPHEVLKNTILLKAIICKARFSKSIEKYVLDLCENWENIKPLFTEILIDCTSGRHNGKKLREQLVKRIKGFGFKVASLFLDILGYEDIAVIDIWAMRFLQNMGCKIIIVYHRDGMKSLTKKEYLKCEDRFTEIASIFGYTPAFFQCIVWVKLSSWHTYRSKEQPVFSFWYNTQNRRA